MNLVVFLLAFFLSFGISYLTILFYKKNNWLDDPKKSSEKKVIHKKAVPRGGGIPTYLGILITCLIFLPIDKHLIGILLGGLLLMIMGVLDDIYNLDPKLRLIVGLLAACLVVGAGIGIAYVSNPFGTGAIELNQPQIAFWLFGKTRTIWILADIFALFWIVSLMNFVNWSKGLDGQLPGTAGIAAIIIAILAERFSADITNWETGVLALAVAGVYLGFLPWNFYPQRMMPGYGGGSLAGYFLAVLAILSTTKVGTLMIVLGVPLIDAIFVMIRRILAGKSPLWGDTRHLHHTLLKMGWSKKKVAYFYWIITLILGIVALLLNSQEKMYTIIIMNLLFLGFLVWTKHSKVS